MIIGNRARRGAAGIAAMFCTLCALAGCSGSPPELARVLSRAVYVHDLESGSYSESLSVFCVASDPDGMDDLSALYVINDDAELYWKVDASAWIKTMAEGETWVGANSLSLPRSGAVPSGSYRVILQDASGETAEDAFLLPDRKTTPPSASYPGAVIEKGAIRITGPYEEVELWVYNNEGSFVQSFSAARKAGPIEVTKIAAASPTLATGFTFWAFANNPRGGYGALAGPWRSGTVDGVSRGAEKALPAR